MKKQHYQVSLDTTADSFLGIHFDHLTDGSVLISGPERISLTSSFPVTNLRSTLMDLHHLRLDTRNVMQRHHLSNKGNFFEYSDIYFTYARANLTL